MYRQAAAKFRFAQEHWHERALMREKLQREMWL
jgi:hypothetical protein